MSGNTGPGEGTIRVTATTPRGESCTTETEWVVRQKSESRHPSKAQELVERLAVVAALPLGVGVEERALHANGEMLVAGFKARGVHLPCFRNHVSHPLIAMSKDKI